MIRTWHIVISGFTQREDSLHGCTKLWDRLMALSNPDTVVGQYEWDHAWDRLAERIRLTSVSDLRICVYAYSWGCGNGMVQLARELRSRAIDVNHAVLTDPVYHSRLPTWIAKGIGVLRQGTITIPSNVRQVDWFRQSKGFPYGCDLRAESDRTDIGLPVILDVPHEAMDDAGEWHRRCMEVAGMG